MRNQKGFTLIEVLIAIAIMTTAVMVVAMAWSGNHLRMRKMKLNNQAAFLLDYKVAMLQRQYKNQFTLVPDEDAGVFEELGPEYKSFTWKLTSKKFELPDLTPFLGGQNGSNGTDPLLAMLMDQMSKFFNQAVKEMTVTVIYTFGKSKIQYSASIFLVDFNRSIPIGGLSGGIPGATQ